MKYSNKFMPVLLGASLLLAASCGSDDDDSSAGVPLPQPEEQQEQEGTFVADLTTLNAGIGENQSSGTANITIKNDQILVDVDMDGVADGIAHAQHIHAGSSCPTLAEDTNGDGFLDVLEGVPSYGPILVPLDSDLTAQAPGDFPVAGADGTYLFNQSASLSALLADLRLPDSNPDDATIKLQPGEQLNLAGRHIVIHGIASDVQLPETVATIGDLPANATLPIACGEIRLVDAETTGGTIGGTTGGTAGTDQGSDPAPTNNPVDVEP